MHWLEHRLGWYRGMVVSAIDGRGTVWIGFKCATCGRISGVHALDQPRHDVFRSFEC
jgi:hypothetical protein